MSFDRGTAGHRLAEPNGRLYNIFRVVAARRGGVPLALSNPYAETSLMVLRNGSPRLRCSFAPFHVLRERT
jgi:hypothetical protein